jgi:hypothetical protein
MKNKKVHRDKNNVDEVLRRMLEFYLMVPPSPYVIKRKRKSRREKIFKNS